VGGPTEEPRVIVELAGVPGAGKSTLAAAAVPALAADGLVARDPASLFVPAAQRDTRQRVRDQVRTVRTTVGAGDFASLCAGRLARSDRGWSRQRRAVSSLTADLEVHRRARQLPPGHVLLWEEGLVHRAILVLVEAGGVAPTDAWVRYAARVPLPDVLVHLQVDAATAVARMEQRPKRLTARLAHLPRPQLEALVTGAVHGLEVLVEEIRRRPDAPAVVQVAPPSPDAALATFTDQVLGHLRR
jgi:hypothetical protein